MDGYSLTKILCKRRVKIQIDSCADCGIKNDNSVSDILCVFPIFCFPKHATFVCLSLQHWPIKKALIKNVFWASGTWNTQSYTIFSDVRGPPRPQVTCRLHSIFSSTRNLLAFCLRFDSGKSMMPPRILWSSSGVCMHAIWCWHHKWTWNQRNPQSDKGQPDSFYVFPSESLSLMTCKAVLIIDPKENKPRVK